jgi:anti-sigma28 factor (negative regulator of flagellin synthesis)
MNKTKAHRRNQSSTTNTDDRTIKNNHTDPLETLKALIYKTQESNQLKIEFIKEELQSGKYETQSDQIARKLMEYSLVSTEEPEIA